MYPIACKDELGRLRVGASVGTGADTDDRVAALIEAGVLKTTLTSNLGKINAANVKRAHKLLEGGHTLGKIVLEGF